MPPRGGALARAVRPVQLAVVALALAAPGIAPAADGTGVALDYAVYLGGMEVLAVRAELHVARGRAPYRLGVNAGTAGLVRLLVDASYEAVAEGRREGAAARPRSFAGTSREDEEHGRTVTLTWTAPAAAPAVAFDPSSAAPDEPLAAPATAGTVDPASAMLTLMGTLAETGRCDAVVAVYDGKRRYDLASRDSGTVTLRSSRLAQYDGPAHVCEVAVARIAGFREGRLGGRYPDTLRIFLAELSDALPPVPVRLQGDNVFGALRMHLVDARWLDG